MVLRNGSDKSVQADFALLADSYMSDHFDVMFSPSIVTYPAGGLATLSLVVRSNSTVPLPNRRQTLMRCLLVARVKNSSAKFTFKCEFELPSSNSSAETMV